MTGAIASYNFAYLDEHTKRMIRRAILKGIAIPGYQVPFASPEMPMPYGWGTGGVQVTAAILGPDDVLVLMAADVTWTPLLLRAGAVVTETGGMLSHASIVAREFGLPCVACVEGATAIPEGALVSVDGAAGEVIVLDATVPPAAPSGAAQADGAVPR